MCATEHSTVSYHNRGRLTMKLTRSYLFILTFFPVLLKIYLFILTERRREGEKEGKKHQCEKERSTNMRGTQPLLGSEHTTQACALTGSEPATLCFMRQSLTN